MLASSPCAVIWLVSLVVVEPVQRHSIRAYAHVLKEVLEVHPSSAHRDAPSAVACVRLMIGLRAPLNHVDPDSSCRRPSSTDIVTMIALGVTGVPVKASARFDHSGQQMRGLHHLLRSTFAKAAAIRRDLLDDREPPELGSYRDWTPDRHCTLALLCAFIQSISASRWMEHWSASSAMA